MGVVKTNKILGISLPKDVDAIAIGVVAGVALANVPVVKTGMASLIATVKGFIGRIF
jgi:hypothetical protein